MAGWQAWSHFKTSAAEKTALEYRDAVELLSEDQDAARTALAAVAEGSGGYGALAALQRAGSYASGGERLREWIDNCPNQDYSALTYQGGAVWRERLMNDLGDQSEVSALLDRRSDAELAARCGQRVDLGHLSQ